MKSHLTNLLATSSSIIIPHRHLQDTLTCLLTSPDPVSCCTNSSDDDDDVCSLLNCVDFSTAQLNENCSCSSITNFCTSTGVFLTALVPEVGELCTAADECCVEDVTENEEFNTCFEEKAVSIEGLSGLVGDVAGDEAEDSDGNLFNEDETYEATTTTATSSPTTLETFGATVEENDAQEIDTDGDETASATAPATDVDDSSGAMLHRFHVMVSVISIALYYLHY